MVRWREALTVISSFLAASLATNCSKRAHKEVDVFGSVILLGKLGAGDIRKTTNGNTSQLLKAKGEAYIY